MIADEIWILPTFSVVPQNNVGGEKVLPIEVEDVLYEMEDASECRVYGEANPVLGQIVAAEIFPKRKMSATEMKALVTSHCKGRLAKYKIPMRIKILTNPIHSARLRKNNITLNQISHLNEGIVHIKTEADMEHHAFLCSGGINKSRLNPL